MSFTLKLRSAVVELTFCRPLLRLKVATVNTVLLTIKQHSVTVAPCSLSSHNCNYGGKVGEAEFKCCLDNLLLHCPLPCRSCIRVVSVLPCLSVFHSRQGVTSHSLNRCQSWFGIASRHASTQHLCSTQEYVI